MERTSHGRPTFINVPWTLSLGHPKAMPATCHTLKSHLSHPNMRSSSSHPVLMRTPKVVPRKACLILPLPHLPNFPSVTKVLSIIFTSLRKPIPSATCLAQAITSNLGSALSSLASPCMLTLSATARVTLCKAELSNPQRQKGGWWKPRVGGGD